MATKASEVDDLTSCPVCFEDFTESGLQVPRILPCFHTLCEQCLEHLLKKNSMECPECRHKHKAPRGLKTFQQNKYIIAYVRKNRKSPPEVVVSQERARCPNHKEDITLFCKESRCKKFICHLCLVIGHRFHDVVNLEEEQKEKYKILVKNIEEVSKLLKGNKERIREFQENLENQHEKSLIMLHYRKEELVRKITEHMDKLAAKLCEDKTDRDAEIQNDMEAIETNIDVIQSLHDDLNEMATLDDINIKSEMVNTVHEEIWKRNTSKTGYTFLEYRAGPLLTDRLEKLCGNNTAVRSEIPGLLAWTGGGQFSPWMPAMAPSTSIRGQIQNPTTWTGPSQFPILMQAPITKTAVRGQVQTPMRYTGPSQFPFSMPAQNTAIRGQVQTPTTWTSPGQFP